jgi:hypothetical protein
VGFEHQFAGKNPTAMASAHKFGQSEELKQAIQKAGVSDHPDVYYLEKASTRTFA